MIIRLANKFDIPNLIQMLWNYHDSGNIPGLEVPNENTALKILTHIFAGAGVVFVSEKHNKLTGMLIAYKTPFLWNNDNFVMNEIAYWVEPEYRGGTSGYRLLAEYVKYCEQLKEEGKISNYTMSQMEGQTLDYSRFGLKPIEHTWSV